MMYRTKAFLLLTLPIFASERLEKAEHEVREAKKEEKRLYAEWHCEPLCEGFFFFQVKGGVAPTVWAGESQFHGAKCEEIDDSTIKKPTIEALGRLPDFSDLLSTPWTVGTEFGIALTNHIKVYTDFQYRQAHGKDFSLEVPVRSQLENPKAKLNLRFHRYRAYSAYVGSDYHFRILNPLSIFVGIKVGFAHHSTMKLRVDEHYRNVDRVGSTQHFHEHVPANTVLSGGGRFGFDWRFWDGLAFILTAECLGNSAPPLQKTVIKTSRFVRVPDVQLGSVGSEVIFPITLGLLYTF